MTRSTRTPWPFPTAQSHPKPAPQSDGPPLKSVQVQDVSEPALDHGVEESFPASDPVSVVPTKVVPAEGTLSKNEGDDNTPAVDAVDAVDAADAAKGSNKAGSA